MGAPETRRVGPLVISAPFGNYVRPVGATATLGTFTAERRPGRVWRVLRTVRYSRRMGAWVNRIGLRNPGVDWLAGRVRSGREDVSGSLVSVHGFLEDEWWRLLDTVAATEPLGIELNISCPNVGEVTWPRDLFERAVATGVRVVVKLPPVRFEGVAEAALSGGVRWFHCCNTLPVPKGGLSGVPLKPLSLRCVGDVRAIAARCGVDGLGVIGGGGVRGAGDVDDYAGAGADCVALGSSLMRASYARYAWDRAWEPAMVREVLDRARAVLPGLVGDQASAGTD